MAFKRDTPRQNAQHVDTVITYDIGNFVLCHGQEATAGEKSVLGSSQPGLRCQQGQCLFQTRLVTVRLCFALGFKAVKINRPQVSVSSFGQFKPQVNVGRGHAGTLRR